MIIEMGLVRIYNPPRPPLQEYTHRHTGEHPAAIGVGQADGSYQLTAIGWRVNSALDNYTGQNPAHKAKAERNHP